VKPNDYNEIEIGLSDLEKRLYGPLLQQCQREQKQWLQSKVCSVPSAEREVRSEDASATTPRAAPRAPHSDWLAFLKIRIGQEMQRLDSLRLAYSRFTRAIHATSNPEDRQHLILDFARELGATPSELKKDKAAFARWFEADAVIDRYHRRHARHEQYTSFLLDRLGAIARQAARNVTEPNAQLAYWQKLELESVVKPLLVHDGDVRLNLAAFRCLATSLTALASEIQELAVDDATLQYIYRSALEHQQQVWIQCAALELLVTLSWASFERALQHRLRRPAAGDDLFVRRRAVELLACHFRRLACGQKLVEGALSDPNAFVRQALPRVAVQAPASLAVPWLKQLVGNDASPQVRAAAWLEWPALVVDPEFREPALRLFREVGMQETQEFVLRVICLVAERCTQGLVRGNDPYLVRWHAAARQVLLHLRCNAASVKVRRWASQALEFIWSECHPEARVLREHCSAFVRSIPRGRSRRLPEALTQDLDPAFLGRVWSIVCRRDYDVQLLATRPGYKVIRGHVFGFRWWRWWHEFRHPSPDKRQAFAHTIGRLFDGQLHVPSAIMAELAQTKVPGEPLHISDEGGWRPYLPLPDQLTSCVELGRTPKPFRIFTSEGTTTVIPPRRWKRWLAAARLTWRFREYAEKRNWLDSMQEPASAYIRSLKELGFKVRFETYEDENGQALPADPMVQRFFPGVMLPIPLATTWDRFRDYFVSLYQNSLPELAVFTAAFTALFFGLHLYFNARLKYWRKRIPLVVGGWGTRGKSGTERLKAALFNAMGLGVVSKTTGCEAMFLQAYPFGPMKEMFLFRPYDKATIWEQIDVVRLAGRLKTDVMLWECMGLTPAYVRILQRSWMRDEFSTITNTYPDHEDLQGPAGINIPEVIGCFIPQKSTVITSEEQMLPILATEAEQHKTALHPVTWLEAGLIPGDILQRFPYEEHPYNIALVLGLAERMGINRDFALKEMADRVVPDLGVLKTYPLATLRTRRLEFTNGMSANERFGTLSNWTRTGFDRQDFLQEPGVWLTTVVNNRADRVPRSQVFARILVNDLSADCHVLIGGNLNGLQGYIREAWSEKAPQLSLWKDPAQPKAEDAIQVLEQQAIQMRLPFKPELIQAHLRIMLSAQPQVTNVEELLAAYDQPEALKSKLSPLNLGEIEVAILNTLQRELRTLGEYHAFAEQVRQARPDQAASLNQRFRELLQQWFQTKLIVVEDYYASGNQIIELIAQRTPPGFLNRIMGIQNIKGTGLDFVYRWQAWQACYHAAQPLCGDKVLLTPQAVAPLAAFQDYGVLCAEFVRDTIARVKNSQPPQPAHLAQELDRILERLEGAMEAIQQKAKSGGGKQAGWFTTFLMRLEEFLDAGDAVRRRTQADQIYKDLIAERISRERAVTELQALTQRQKGGWLLKKFSSFAAH
jgi:poly-gamma-glutamate synthase PgsB/CapB